MYSFQGSVQNAAPQVLFACHLGAFGVLKACISTVSRALANS
jgi:hypothetical protein